MNFCWVTLHVKNLEASLAFYHGLLGLPIDSRFGKEGTSIAMLGEKDQPKIELLQSGAGEEETFHSDMTVGIRVESLEGTMEYLREKQIPVIRGPISPNPVTSFIFIKDPDGYEVQLVAEKS